MGFRIISLMEPADPPPAGWDFAGDALEQTYDFVAAGLSDAGNPGGLTSADPIGTAVLIQLTTEARARSEDRVPSEVTDRRGWAGDHFGNDASRGEGEIGSRLWTLQHWPPGGARLARAKALADEALHTLIRQGVARSIDVTVEDVGLDRIDVAVTIQPPRGVEAYARRYAVIWEPHIGA